jgi:hypothetical protein
MKINEQSEIRTSREERSTWAEIRRNYRMGLDYLSYEEAKNKFRWSDRWTLYGDTKDKFNIVHECV